MRSVGEVVHADVLTTPDGRSKGCGLVEYTSAEQVCGCMSFLRVLCWEGMSLCMCFVCVLVCVFLSDIWRRPLTLFVHIHARIINVKKGRAHAETDSFIHARRHAFSAGSLPSRCYQSLKANKEDIHAHTYTFTCTSLQAQRAIAELNDTELMGRMVFVREDRETR
jgi:hypothetical protein